MFGLGCQYECIKIKWSFKKKAESAYLKIKADLEPVYPQAIKKRNALDMMATMALVNLQSYRMQSGSA